MDEEDTEAARPGNNDAAAQRGPGTTLRFTVTADGVTMGHIASSPPAAVLREAGDERWTSRPPTESQLRARHLRLEAHRKRTMDRKVREQVRQKLFDRWKKRNFYLVEEEGNTPPAGFDDEEDVLGDTTATEGLDSKDGQPPLSARSRSSSKVRFAEETDEYEVRSNPSTSSRSVPERWGGMDIPDAERDMGKEILYVVTQQAFNELLDVLFKERENLAVKAAHSKEWREAYRDVLDAFDPDAPQSPRSQRASDENAPARTPEADENKPVRDRNLPELLIASGYMVDESLVANGEQENEEDYETASAEEQSSDEASEEDSDLDEEDMAPRDPTMPQFRPNSEADASRINAPKTAGRRPKPAKLKGLEEAGHDRRGSSQRRPKDRPLQRPPRVMLLDWKKLDRAEAEAKERGGWGRLTLSEFKDIWHQEEGGPRRLDYLGTWIDFCIP